MPPRSLRAFALAAGLAAASAGGTAQGDGFVGAYIWGGMLGKSPSGLERFHDSVERVFDAGFDTIRFKIGINQAKDYALAPDPCPGRESLACYAKAMLADKVWDRPELRRLILTTVDWSCFTYRGGNGNGCLVADQLAANAEAIKAEYRDLLEVVATRFRSRRIEVILTNWEGDNFSYCGDSYRFALDHLGFAKTCRATWPRGQTNAQRVAAFLRWTDLKAEAASAFRRRHPDFDVKVAPEFNTFAVFKTECPRSGACRAETDTVLDAIAAAGGRDYCSWSSYDSEGDPHGAYLAAVKDVLKACRHLFIGEGGYDLAHFPKEKAVRLFEAMDEIRHVPNVIGVVPWHAFDAPNAPTRYGFWTAEGAPQVIDLLGPLRPRSRR